MLQHFVSLYRIVTWTHYRDHNKLKLYLKVSMVSSIQYLRVAISFSGRKNIWKSSVHCLAETRPRTSVKSYVVCDMQSHFCPLLWFVQSFLTVLWVVCFIVTWKLIVDQAPRLCNLPSKCMLQGHRYLEPPILGVVITQMRIQYHIT
jgi:hypothetical protein